MSWKTWNILLILLGLASYGYMFLAGPQSFQSYVTKKTTPQNDIQTAQQAALQAQQLIQVNQNGAASAGSLNTQP